MTVVQQGTINTTALIVPDLYVQLLAPQISNLNGVPTNILGVVGTATWGPINAPTVVSSMADYGAKFGAIQARTYDAGTAVAAAVLQGANNIRVVRVTDGTDVAATGTLTAMSAGDAAAIVAAINNGQTGLRAASQLVVASNTTTTVTITAKYTGTLGNTLVVSIGPGSKAATTKVTITMPGQVSEVYDNIGTAAASAASATMSAGTDGATTITGTVLVGVDTTTRKGMYALRGTGCAVAFLADVGDSTTFAAQIAYGLSEGTYMIGATPSGDTIANAITVKSTGGFDSYIFKYLFGDWVYFNDTVNSVIRLISPQGFVAGCFVNQAPQNSALNKQLYGIVGTQRSTNNQLYSSAELQLLGAAGIDVVCNPAPGGAYFACRFGHNSSSNALTNQDAYTRMTNYVAYTFNSVMGKFVGQLQSQQANDPLRSNVSAVMTNFLSNLQQQGQIDAYQVQCNLANNPPSRIQLGYLQVDVSVRYLTVVEKFLINMQGGTSVAITSASVAAATS
jgi:hypothetical protein